MTRLRSLLALPLAAGLLAAPVAAHADWGHGHSRGGGGGYYHGGPAWHGGHYGGGYNRGGYYGGGPGWWTGAAVAAGVLGLGAVIANSVAPPVYYAPPPVYYAAPPVATYSYPQTYYPPTYYAPGY